MRAENNSAFSLNALAIAQERGETVEKGALNRGKGENHER